LFKVQSSRGVSFSLRLPARKIASRISQSYFCLPWLANDKRQGISPLHAKKVLAMPAPNRRLFAQSAVAASIFASARVARGNENRSPRILLRSSWQTVNIGDIAHTPGVLAILEKHLPEAEVYLWPSNVNHGVREMLLQRFPKLKIVERSTTGAESQPSSVSLQTAFAECDFLLHSSGPSLVAEKDVVRWANETQKPYGIYGITLPLQSSSSTKPTDNATFTATLKTLSAARFVFFRDSVSLQLAKDRGCTCPIMEFGPDGAFATDLTDDERALTFLEQHGLEEGKFLCCIPRLRYTPYWLIPEKKAERDATKHARNEAMKEHDHLPHRQAIIDVVRKTDLKILVCPEDRTQMAVGKEMLVDPLPEDVKASVVWRPEYWLTGEAISTYKRSAGLFGNEMHSPIMSIGHGIPAIVCRWAEQTSKGLMWRDIGLNEWLFDFDNEADVNRLPATVLALAKDPAAAKEKAARAREFVESRQRESMLILGQQLKAIIDA
jgi:polysaccharide pyruvyl transferase WcaK-like protein